jgi:GH24 family phage-related lysozyme (muramidase)
MRKAKHVAFLSFAAFVSGLAFGLGAGIEFVHEEVVIQPTPIVLEYEIKVQPSQIMEIAIERAEVFEGFEAEVYELFGMCHIGYGHLTYCGNPDIHTVETASELLYSDMSAVKREVMQALSFYDELPSNAQVVLMDMGLNMGVPSLLKFEDMLGNMETGNWFGAVLAIEDSLYFNQVNNRAEQNIDLLWMLAEQEGISIQLYVF